MASTTILSDNGASSGSAGLKSTAGNDGVLILQTTTSGGTATNVMYADTAQNVGFGITPSAWLTSYSNKAIQVGPVGSIYSNSVSSSNKQMAISSNTYLDSGAATKYIADGHASTYIQYGGNHVFSSAVSGTAGGAVSFTDVLVMAKDKSLALQGASVQTGTGITFPATQSASSDANTLDDYEEGTWTPTVLGTSTNPTVTYQGSNGGRYIKIGKMVYLQCYLRWLNLSGGSGSMLIGGLPYTTANSTQAIGLSGVTEWNGAFPTTATYPTPNIESGINQTFLYVLRNGPGVSGVNVPISALANADTYLLFGFCYESST